MLFIKLFKGESVGKGIFALSGEVLNCFAFEGGFTGERKIDYKKLYMQLFLIL